MNLRMSKPVMLGFWPWPYCDRSILAGRERNVHASVLFFSFLVALGSLSREHWVFVAGTGVDVPGGMHVGCVYCGGVGGLVGCCCCCCLAGGWL